MSTSGKQVHSCQKGVQCEDQIQENPEEPRHSCRSRNPTVKMLELQKDEAQKRERKLSCLYDQWKIQAHKAWNQLKADIPESQLASLVEALEKAKENVLSMYVTPWTETRRRIDACEAVTRDILKIAYERILGINLILIVEEKNSAFMSCFTMIMLCPYMDPLPHMTVSTLAITAEPHQW